MDKITLPFVHAHGVTILRNYLMTVAIVNLITVNLMMLVLPHILYGGVGIHHMPLHGYQEKHHVTTRQ